NGEEPQGASNGKLGPLCMRPIHSNGLHLPDTTSKPKLKWIKMAKYGAAALVVGSVGFGGLYFGIRALLNGATDGKHTLYPQDFNSELPLTHILFHFRVISLQAN